jgi:hypothetical protein
MSAQKKMSPKKGYLALLIGGASVEHSPSPPSKLSLIFGLLFPTKSDLTIDCWEKIERKRGFAAAAHRDPLSPMHWHA